MKKAIIILLTALVALSVFVSCNQDSIIDEEFNKFATVTFDSNNGSGLTATQTIMKKTPTALDANGFKYAEHAFVCWNTKADGAGDTYTDTQEVKLESSMTLYAQWSEVDTITEETTTLVPGRAYTTAGEETIISERIMISASDIIEEGGSTSRDAILKEERKPVVIFLEKGTTLIVEKGIEVAEGQELNIQGSGTLIATAGVGAAGIGGGPGVNAGTIVISGGTIITTGGTFAAGIGGGKEGNGGVVTIIDGDVTATGGLSGGAGIGGGNKGNGGNVSILGGTVNVFGGEPSVSIPRGIAIGAGHGGKSAGSLEIGEGLGLYGGKDEASAEFLSFPTDSYTGARCEFMETKETQYATITFAANGGEGEMEAQVVPYNIPRKLNANEFTHETLFFDGWALSEEGEVKYKNQAQIELDGDITLYAHWIDVIMIDDTYGGADGKKLEGGKRYSIESDQTIEKRLYIDGTDEVTLTLPQGSTLTLSSGLNVASGQSLTIEGEGSLVAQGGANEAGIGGGSGESAGTITINGGTITATGGSGGGIGIGAGSGSTEHGVLKINKGLGLFGGADKDNVAFLSAPVDSYAGDRTDYMESKATSYVTVTFKPNGGEQTKDKTQTIPKGFGVPLAENTFTHKTLTFAGWITDTAKEEADYSDKQVVTLENNLTLYALWIDVIVLDASYGGTGGNKLEGGKSYTIESNLTITDRLYIADTNNVTLILPKNSTLTLSNGLNVASGQSLTIEGEGTLTATGAVNAAGIGGGANCDGGAVTINGGTVTATGGNYAAGIGGGYCGNGGEVTISGGKVTATGGEYGAGIGRGHEGSSNGTLKIGDGQGLYGGADKDNVAFLSAPVDSYAGDRPVYMKSEATEYVTVTFDANDAKAEGTMNPQTVPKDLDIALNANAFKHETLSFYGWNTQADGKGTSYSNKQKVTLESNLTLYAQWVDIVYLTAESTTLDGGKTYSIQDDLPIPNRLSIDGIEPVTILLPEGKTLTLEKGISVTGGKSLIIDGEGTLTATGDASGNLYASAGIGGSMSDRSCGTVTIKGGIVNATGGGTNGAGIGGGYYQGWGGSGGTINILGGTVTATGGEYGGAGIGGGGGDGGHGGNVTISGGTVTAIGNSGAGIGGGKYCDGGTVTISGGTVTATGSTGIGGGDCGNGGEVTISGGKVTATGKSGGAGIGGGCGSFSQSFLGGDGGIVTISGGEVVAKGSFSSSASSGGAAGIGGGQGNLNAGGAGATVSITGGTVTATGGGNNTVGIGRGDGNVETVSNGSLAIGSIEGLYGGDNKDSSKFISIPTESYTGSRYHFMEVKPTNYVTITYNANGGTETMDPQYVPLKIDRKLALNTYTNDDLYFAGWSLSSDGAVEYPDTDTFTPEKDITLYAQWSELPCISPATEKLEDGLTYTIACNVTNSNRLSINGSAATIILPEEMTLTLTKGINVPEGKSLTIDGEGTLEARGGQYQAGIGGNANQVAGSVTIKGGTVNATGGAAEGSSGGGAGIGGGGASSGEHGYAGGTVLISGGKVTATGAHKAAGIGGGGCRPLTLSSYGGAGGNVTITGGEVIANGGSYGAGIGGGSQGHGGSVSISGGKVTANGGTSAYGIGGGHDATVHGSLVYDEVVSIQVSTDNSDWTAYDGETRERYMKAETLPVK